MDKVFKRGLRQLKIFQRKRLQPIDKEKIRKKVQSLYEFDEGDVDEVAALSKFNMEAFKSDVPRFEKIITKVNDFEIETVMNFINESCTCDNLKLYRPRQDDPQRVSQLVLSLSNSPARRALLQSILTNFKGFFPERRISVDGNCNKRDSDWIVIDLKTVFVHIIDPKTRIEMNLDEKFERAYSNCKPEDQSLPNLMESLKKSLPRSIASRPNFIEKYIKSKSLSQA